MRSTNLLSYTRILQGTFLKIYWLNKTLDMKILGFSHSELFARCSAWRSCRARWWIVGWADFQNKNAHVISLSFIREIPVIAIWHVFFERCWYACAGTNLLLVTLVNSLLCVKTMFVLVWNYLSFACGITRASMCSPVGHLRHPTCTCRAQVMMWSACLNNLRTNIVVIVVTWFVLQFIVVLLSNSSLEWKATVQSSNVTHLRNTSKDSNFFAYVPSTMLARYPSN